MYREEKYLNGAQDFVKKPTLFNVPYNYNLEENETDKVIKIKATFDTNPLFGEDKYYFDYKMSNQDIKDAMHNVELPSEYVEDSYEFVKIIKEEL